ncbi:MAG: hypothetical protein MUF34_06235 [Polyangiaceae bacterium]|jgi:hypothetical protein|nr:hypothetical protein [Polyangiaceae bacterium]
MPTERPLRNEVIARALDQAIASGDHRVLALLANAGGAGGPRPNVELAAAVGEELALASGPGADTLLGTFLAFGERKAQGRNPEVFLPYAAAFALVARVVRGRGTEGSWSELHGLAGDGRALVREGVVTALSRAALSRAAFGAEFIERASGWTDGFLHAAVVLEVVTTKAFLESPMSFDGVRDRLGEALELAENAPRSAERSQGRRRLLEVIELALVPLLLRHRDLGPWLQPKLSTQQPELRAAFEGLMQRLSRAGAPVDLLEPLRAELDRTAPPRRDPTTFRGATRGRGRKAQGRSAR